jgi:hypothetical protein
MSTQTVEQRLRLFLLGLAAFLCAGTIVELVLQEHYTEPLQFVPLLFCAVGFVLILLVILRPSRATITILRVVMALGVLASLVGVYEHMEQNMGFVLDITPNAPMFDAFMEALRGAAPLLAPGILAIIGALAWMGTYAHPAVFKRKEI